MKARYIVKRYVDILGRLSNGKRASFEQLIAVIESQDEQMTFTRRTFQRMLQDIEWIFYIQIKCDKNGFYYIAQDDSDSEKIKLAQSFQFINYQKHFENFEKHIAFDTQCIQGQQYIYDIQMAIKERNAIEFLYKKYTANPTSERRIIEPYGLKEYKGRWYMVGKDRAINEIRIFGLDRILKLDMLSSRFKMPSNFNIHQYFKEAIGTIVPKDGVSEIIELHFSNQTAGLVRNMPIHSSQKILEENEGGLSIRLRTYISVELVNELMNYSDDVKVVKPLRLRKMLLKRAEQIKENNTEI